MGGGSHPNACGYDQPALVLLRCVWDFFVIGKGTLAPIDPPRFLVVQGLYRFTRNPVYNGVIALILGEAWLFGSVALVEYALLVLVFFHLLVVFHEEPTLESQFGESYRAYRRAVPRWGFTTRPFQESTGSTATLRCALLAAIVASTALGQSTSYAQVMSTTASQHTEEQSVLTA